jgi:hypothetical protein
LKELFQVYFPNSEDIPDQQSVKAIVSQEIVNKTWQAIREEIIELTSQALKKEFTEEQSKEMVLKLAIESSASQYTIFITYHPQIPFSDKIKELITTTPLKLEIEYLKKKQEQLPTTENFIKLEKQKSLLENYLQDLTDQEKYEEIKAKVKEIE